MAGAAAVAAKGCQAPRHGRAIISVLLRLIGKVEGGLPQTGCLGSEVFRILPDLRPRARLDIDLIHARTLGKQVWNLIRPLADMARSFRNFFRAARTLLYVISNGLQVAAEFFHELLPFLDQRGWIGLSQRRREKQEPDGCRDTQGPDRAHSSLLQRISWGVGIPWSKSRIEHLLLELPEGWDSSISRSHHSGLK